MFLQNLLAFQTHSVRFAGTVGDWGYGWQIDNIVVQQPQGSAPDQCANMAPVDAATDVEITTENGYKVVNVFLGMQ